MNARELASLILLGTFVVLPLLSRRTRSAFTRLLLALLSPKLAAPLVLFGAWTLLMVIAARAVRLWSVDLVGSTIIWFLLVGLAWFMKVTDAAKDPRFFKRRIAAALGVAAFLEFFVNLEVLSLPWELVLQVLLFLVLLLNTFAKQIAGFAGVARLTGIALGLSGLGLTVYTIIRLADHWDSLVVSDLARQLALPIWLTIAAIPYLYLFALFMGYEVLVTNMKLWNDFRPPPLRVVAGAVVELKVNLADIDQFRGVAAKRAVRAGSFAGARHVVRDFKHQRETDRASRTAARQRLTDFTGAEGVAADGRRLDRREFGDTKAALLWLSTCHMGWYRQAERPNAYRADLLIMLTETGFKHLGANHRVTMKVRDDGDAWLAYRTTPSGYVFGIGADGPPPSQWFYDGDQEPTGFPSRDGGWTYLMDPDRPEWKDERPT